MGPGQGIADDGGPQVADVHLLSDVRGRVVDDDPLLDLVDRRLGGRAFRQLSGEEVGGEAQVDESGSGDLRGLADVGELEVVDDGCGDVAGLRPHLLGQGQGEVGLEVRELTASDHGIATREVLTEGLREGGGETIVKQ